MTTHKNTSLGVIWMLVFCWASTMADGIIRYITMEGLPAGQVLFVRCALGAVILLPFVVKNKTLRVPKNIMLLYFYRGLFAFMGAATWFYFLKHVDFTALMAVGFTSPLFAAMMAMLFLGEKFSATKVAALLIGFSGAMVVVQPFDADFNVYLVLAVGSSFVWSISVILAKKLSASQPPLTVAFYFAAMITPFSLVLALLDWHWPSAGQWGFLLLLVGLATLGQFAVIKAFNHAELTTLMPLGYSELIFAAIFSYAVFGDVASIYTWLGGAIILGSGYIIVRLEKKQKHQPQELETVP